MTDTATLDALLTTHQATLDEANEALVTGDLDTAESLLQQSLTALEPATATDRIDGFKLQGARSSLHEALGVLATQRGVAADAEQHYRLALQLRTMMAEGGAGEEGFDTVVPRAVSHLNLAGLLANQERLEEAHQHAIDAVQRLADALEMVEAAGEETPPELDLMLLSALHTTAMVRASGGDLESAAEAFEQGLGYARAVLLRTSGELLDEDEDEDEDEDGDENEDGDVGEDDDGTLEISFEHAQEFLPLYGQLLSNAAMVQNALEQHLLALELAGEAAGIGEALLEATESEEALELYLNAQLAAMQYASAASRFDRAEDALFKALALAPDSVELLMVGEQFYEQLLDKSDVDLTQGGLPREEVLDSLDELRQRRVAASG